MFLKVIATPGAKKETIEEREGNTLYIAVREPALQNHANTRIRELLALRYHVPVTRVRILTGHHARSKMVSITD